MEEKERYEWNSPYDSAVRDNKNDDIINAIERLNEQDKRIKELEEKIEIQKNKEELIAENEAMKDTLAVVLAQKRNVGQANKKLRNENQQLKQQLALTKKALELACEHIKEDLKCDDTENEIYNYFKTQAKEMLENE